MNGTLFDTGVDVKIFEGDISGNASGLIVTIVSGLVEFIEELLVFPKVLSGSLVFSHFAEVAVYIEDKVASVLNVFRRRNFHGGVFERVVIFIWAGFVGNSSILSEIV